MHENVVEYGRLIVNLHTMKFAVWVCLLLVNRLYAQVVTIQWNRTYGTPAYDGYPLLITTLDGGLIVCGNTDAGLILDKTASNKGGTDIWLIKLNSSGHKVWDRTIGSAGQDSPRAIVKTSDGGFMIACTSESSKSFDKLEDSRGWEDYWIVKVNQDGQKVWDRTFVGDLWLVRISDDGTKLWDKTIGGSHDDNHSSLAVLDNITFFLGALPFSNRSFDKSEDQRGNYDCWIL